MCVVVTIQYMSRQGQTDHSSTRALPEGLGSVWGSIKCPWYLL
ncbi:unnamed protein product [Staurois parvus]|uniref:Uncharacterized protein n=1 Tax=Staurois parvus TaxID=386267 RepID=A0ABN9DRW5_9NEOB|nr:unnamed protein product [Staurois parvus]